MKRQLVAIILLFFLGAIWGSGYSIARYATTHGVNPLGYAFWQALGPSLFLLLVTVHSKKTVPVKPNYLLFYFLTGLFGIAIPNSNMYFVAPHLPAGLVAILVNTVPLITYVLTLLIRQERFSWIRFLGVSIGLAGIFLILVPKLSLDNHVILSRALLLLLTPFCFAICAIYATQFSSHKNSSMQLATGMLIAATFLLLPVVIFSHSFYLFHWPLTTSDWLIFLEILLSSVGYVLFFLLLKKTGPVYYSLVGGIVMLTGLFWGWLVFGEKLNHWTSLAAFLILIGVCLVTLSQQYNKSRKVTRGT